MIWPGRSCGLENFWNFLSAALYFGSLLKAWAWDCRSKDFWNSQAAAFLSADLIQRAAAEKFWKFLKPQLSISDVFWESGLGLRCEFFFWNSSSCSPSIWASGLGVVILKNLWNFWNRSTHFNRFLEVLVWGLRFDKFWKLCGLQPLSLRVWPGGCGLKNFWNSSNRSCLSWNSFGIWPGGYGLKDLGHFSNRSNRFWGSCMGVAGWRTSEFFNLHVPRDWKCQDGPPQ